MSDWSAIEALPSPKLVDLFADDPNRLATFSTDVAGIHFDWSKTHLTKNAVAAFEKMCAAQDLAGKRAALFAGEHVNVTEDRPVTHTEERGEGNPEIVATAQKFHQRMRALIDAIEGGALGEIRSNPSRRHRWLGAWATPARRCAGPRREALRGRDRLQRRWRRAGGRVREIRSQDHNCSRSPRRPSPPPRRCSTPIR